MFSQSGATVTVDTLNTTVYARRWQGGTSTNIGSQAIAGTSATFNVGGGLTAGTEYTVQASTSAAYLSSQSATSDAFTTVTTVDISPHINAGPNYVDSNKEFTPVVSAGVPNFRVTVSGNGGTATLAATSRDLDCDSPTSSLTIASTGTFWTRWCTLGGVHIDIFDAAHASVTQHFSTTVTELVPGSLTGITMSDITTTSGRFAVNLTNPNTQSLDIELRAYLFDGADDRWEIVAGNRFGTSSSITSTTTWPTNPATSTINTIGGSPHTPLVPGTEYQVAAIIGTGLDALPDNWPDPAPTGAVTTTFTTVTTVALDPDPSTLSPARLSTQTFTPVVSAGVETVTISATGGVSLSTAAVGDDCLPVGGYHSVTHVHDHLYWARFCEAGSATLTITDNGNTAVSTSYTVTVSGALANATGVAMSAITHESATATVAVSNPDSGAGTVHLRYRTPPGILDGSDGGGERGQQQGLHPGRADGRHGVPGGGVHQQRLPIGTDRQRDFRRWPQRHRGLGVRHGHHGRCDGGPLQHPCGPSHRLRPAQRHRDLRLHALAPHHDLCGVDHVPHVRADR